MKYLILRYKGSTRTSGHDFALAKEHNYSCYVRKYSLSLRTINVYNKSSTDHVLASSVNMLKNIIDTYLVRVTRIIIHMSS